MSDGLNTSASELIVNLWHRIGFIRSRGFPWQRKEAALLQEAAECLQALRAGYETAMDTNMNLRGEVDKLRRIEAIILGRPA